MATAARLAQHEAAALARTARYDEALGALDAEIGAALQIAQTELLTGMLAVGDACLVEPEARETLVDTLETTTEAVVRGIFAAAVKEVGKRDYAAKEARAAGEEAAMKVHEEQQANALSRMGTRGRRRPSSLASGTRTGRGR